MTSEQILVVEDSDRNMKLYRDVLQATGFRTLEATTCERAVGGYLSKLVDIGELVATVGRPCSEVPP